MKGKKMEIKENTRYILNNGSVVTLRATGRSYFGCSAYVGWWDKDGRYIDNGRVNHHMSIKCEEKAMRWVPIKKHDVSMLLLQNPDLSFKKIKNHWFVEISREEAQRLGAEQQAKAAKPDFGKVDLPNGDFFVWSYSGNFLNIEISNGAALVVPID